VRNVKQRTSTEKAAFIIALTKLTLWATNDVLIW
jgi:hypothetical protein